MNITGYRVAAGNTRQEFEREINDLIKLGWQLHGDTIFAPELRTFSFWQNTKRLPIFLQPMICFERS